MLFLERSQKLIMKLPLSLHLDPNLIDILTSLFMENQYFNEIKCTFESLFPMIKSYPLDLVVDIDIGEILKLSVEKINFYRKCLGLLLLEVCKLNS